MEYCANLKKKKFGFKQNFNFLDKILKFLKNSFYVDQGLEIFVLHEEKKNCLLKINHVFGVLEREYDICFAINDLI